MQTSPTTFAKEKKTLVRTIGEIKERKKLFCSIDKTKYTFLYDRQMLKK